MWWLDDNLYRGNSGDRKRLLYRASLPQPQNKPPLAPQDGNVTWQLSASQMAANKVLMQLETVQELETDQDSQIERLRADIASLEKAVREQAAQRDELQTKVQQQADEHAEQLAETLSNSQRNLETQESEFEAKLEQLRQQLDESEKLVAQQVALATAGNAEADHLNKLLSTADNIITARDAELTELRSELEACKQQYAERLTEAEREYAAELERLRTIALAAERRAVERKGRIATLESELGHLTKTHALELGRLRDSMEVKLRGAKASLCDASDRVETQGKELATLTTHVERLQAENQAQCSQLQVAADAEAAAQLHLSEVLAQHEKEQADLQSRIKQLQNELAAQQQEASALKATTDQTACEQSATIAELKGKLAAVTADSRQFNRSATELQQQTATLQTTIDRLKQAAVERQSMHESEVKSLQSTIQQLQDAVIQQTCRAKRIESVLRSQRHTLARRIEQLTSQATERRMQHRREITSLEESIRNQRVEIRMLADEAEKSTRKLDRNHGALERFRSKNERILEIHDSHLTTLQSRIDALVIALDAETKKRAVATAEARRLADARSRRLTFLGQQRQQLSGRIEQLRSENQRLRAEGTRLRAEADSTDWSLQKATNGLRAQASTIKQLRAQLDALTSAQAEDLQQNSDRQAASTREIRRLSVLLDQTKSELQECRKQLSHQPIEAGAEGVDIEIAQRDRTIAVLKQEAVVMQERLHRVAAARRKAEGAIKREATSEEAESDMHDTWSTIDAHQQVERFKRQITALENIGRLERQRAAAEISRYKEKIKQLKRKSDNRAA